ncbi:hypothetical protein [Actinokineospora sp.]|uniref:hypothetical protein n=1 Tax=Actinokineospora sp. TaxID=1872133 RepID=UPI004037776A
MHWHGYVWQGDGKDVLPSDATKRSNHPMFAGAGQLPYVVNHTLMKPRSFVKGTWLKVNPAAQWLVNEHAQLPPKMYPVPDWASTPEERALDAVERLKSGRSVVWSFWLNGARYVDMRVVCCSPTDFNDDIPCPTGV